MKAEIYNTLIADLNAEYAALQKNFTEVMDENNKLLQKQILINAKYMALLHENAALQNERVRLLTEMDEKA